VGELKCKLGELKLSTTGAKQTLFNRLAGHSKPGQWLHHIKCLRA
jgi:hypothetical protein